MVVDHRHPPPHLAHVPHGCRWRLGAPWGGPGTGRGSVWGSSVFPRSARSQVFVISAFGRQFLKTAPEKVWTPVSSVLILFHLTKFGRAEEGAESPVMRAEWEAAATGRGGPPGGGGRTGSRGRGCWRPHALLPRLRERGLLTD